MNTEIEVSVTAEDIENGECGSPMRCAAALAINRWLDKELECGASATVYFYRSMPLTLLAKVKAPAVLCDFIQNFDRSDDNPRKTLVEPLSFPLVVPSYLLKPELREMKG